jgi:hypothetical protein
VRICGRHFLPINRVLVVEGMETFKEPRTSQPGPDNAVIVIVITFLVIYFISQSNSLRQAIHGFCSGFFNPTPQQSTLASSQRIRNRTNGKSESEPFKTLTELQEAIRKAGLEASHLIIGIDFTKSNTWSGKKSFEGFCLHDTSREGIENPYQKVMRIISKSLSCYDEDQILPAYGFGDIETQGRSCFPFYPDRDCYGLNEVLDRYNEIVSRVQLSGPTNFAPVTTAAPFR